MKTSSKILGRILLDETKRQGMTIYSLAKAAGVNSDSTYLTLAGNSDPQFSTLLRLLGGLGCTLHWLAREYRKAEHEAKHVNGSGAHAPVAALKGDDRAGLASAGDPGIVGPADPGNVQV